MAHVPSRGSSDLRPRARRHRLLAGAAVTILLLGGTVYRSSRASHIATHTGPPKPITSLALDTEPVRLPDASARGLESPVYPYSIIPGGARSKEALQRSIESDPIVRAHYANFDLAATRIVRLTQPRLAYVSYRMGNEIYWTRRPLVLKAGETVLTDGRNYARTRCGNQLAAAPPVVSDKEPSPALLNTPLPLLHRTLWLPKLPMVNGLSALNYVVMDPGWQVVRPIPSIPGMITTLGTPDLHKPSLEGDSSPFPKSSDEPPTVGSLPPSSLPPGSQPPTETPNPPSTPPNSPPSEDPPTLRQPDDPSPPDEPPVPPTDPPTDPPNTPVNPPVSVPEPGTMLLLGAGAGFVLRRRKSEGK